MTLNQIDISRSFEFVTTDKETQKWTGIKLLSVAGKYENIIYKYGKVEVGEEETKEGDMPLTFHYDVLYSPQYTPKELQEDMEFKNLLGDILITIIESQLKEDNLEYVNTDNWKNNT